MQKEEKNSTYFV